MSSIINAKLAAEITKTNREHPVNSILRCIETSILNALNGRADAILWKFYGEDILYMDEVITELQNLGYEVKEFSETEDSTSFTVRISWL